MSAKRRFSIHFALALVSEVFNKIFPLFVLKLATARLGLAGFGMAQYGIGVIEMVAPFVIWGYNSYGLITLGKYADDHQKKAEIISNIVVLRLVHAVACIILLNVFIAHSPGYEKYQSLFAKISVFLFFSATEMLWVNVASQKLAIVTLFTFVAKASSFLAIYLFVNDPHDAILLAVLTLSSNALISLFTTIWGRKWLSIQEVTWSKLRSIFMSSQSFAVVVVMYALIDRLDLVIVERAFGTIGAGLYTGPMRIANSLGQIVGALLLPIFAEIVVLKEREAIRNQVKIALEFLSLSIFPMVAGVIIIHDDIINLLLGEEFRVSGTVLMLQTCSIIPFALTQIFGNQILLTFGRVKLFGSILIIGTILYIGLIVTCSSLWGLNGAALGTFSGKMIIAMMTIIAARQIMGRLDIRPCLKPLTATALMTSTLLVAEPQTSYVAIALGMLSYCLACLVLYHRQWYALLQRYSAQGRP